MTLSIAMMLTIAIGMIGSILLHISWKRHSTIFAVFGWVCLLVTLPLWFIDTGWEYGSVFALFLPAIYVWFSILRERKTQKESRNIEKLHTPIHWNNRKVINNTWLIVYHLILLMLVSSLLTIVLVDFLPLDRPTQLAIGIITLPLIWAGLSFWHLVAIHKRLALIFSLLSSITTSIYLFV